MIKVEYVSADGTIKDRFELADGMTLEQAARTMFPDTEGKFPVPTIAIVGATPAVRELGDWQWPLKDDCVQFRQLAMGGGGGGGSNPLQMVLQVALIALATAATIWMGGEGGLLMAAGLGLNAANFAAGMIGVGVMMLGTMLMGALFPNKQPQAQLGAQSAEQASPTYSINSNGNQARLYQQEPEQFGRMKIKPDFVSNTWTQYIGNDQIGYFVYGLGRGHYQVESLQFGETVFWRDGALVEGTGYEIQDIEFVEPGQPVTIFPDNVVTSTEVSGQTLFAPNDSEFDGGVGPYAANAPGTQTDTLLLDFVLQQGLGRYADDGSLQWAALNFDIEARRIDDFGKPLGDWVLLETVRLWMSTTTPQRITQTYKVAKGRYECRCKRTSNKNWDGKTFDAVSWAAMRAILPGTYTYPISCVAFSIKANNALTQNASRQFAIVATRKLPLYDRKTKKWGNEVPTRSWAAAVSHVCRCEWGGRLPDSNIDLDTLWAIDEKLAARGWHYDAYLDGPNLVWTLLCEMCQSQCVIPRLIGPVLSFVLDSANRPPTFALTPRNIMRNSFSVTYHTWSDETPDDVTMEYLDADYGWQKRDVTATLPDSESREPASMDVLGITDRAHAHKVAVAYAAHNRWQRISVECQVEALGRIINRGDICTVAHPRFKNTCSGAVESWNEKQLQLCVQFDMRMPESDKYYIDKKGQTTWPKTLEALVRYGIKGSEANKIIVDKEDTLLIDSDFENGNRRDAIARSSGSRSGWYISLTRPDGSIWGPCKIKSVKDDTLTLDSADYSTLLLQGQGNPFEWITAGINRQPTTWTLYTSKTYQRLMVVDAIQSQDLLHYSLKLLNYDDRIYQYGNLPVPAWQGRGQLPVTEKMPAPRLLRGILITETTINLTWLSVPQADWYEVQISSDGTKWQSLGRSNNPQMSAVVSQGKVYARVRACTESLTSAWTKWEGNTTLLAPGSPTPVLSGTYSGGEARISWAAVANADNFQISLLNGNAAIYTATQTGRGFLVTPEIQEGGPFRNLTVKVVARNEKGTSAPGTLALSDPAPAAPQSAEITISGNSATLKSLTPDTANKTGYVIAKGATANFTASQIEELRQISALPYTWSGLAKGTHYFRIAIKDDFYEIAKNPRNLNWSAVMPVEVA